MERYHLPRKVTPLATNYKQPVRTDGEERLGRLLVGAGDLGSIPSAG